MSIFLDDIFLTSIFSVSKEGAVGEERPRFGKKGGRQVRTIRGIKTGQTYIEFNKQLGAMSLIQIISRPFKEDKFMCVRAEVLNNDGEASYIETISLADDGVVPYSWSDGPLKWNQWNCLLRTKAKTLKNVEKRTDIKKFQPVFF